MVKRRRSTTGDYGIKGEELELEDTSLRIRSRTGGYKFKGEGVELEDSWLKEKE